MHSQFPKDGMTSTNSHDGEAVVMPIDNKLGVSKSHEANYNCDK